jgi:hypothetical protein
MYIYIYLQMLDKMTKHQNNQQQIKRHIKRRKKKTGRNLFFLLVFTQYDVKKKR